MTEHSEARHRELVAVGEVVGGAQTQEEIVAVVACGAVGVCEVAVVICAAHHVAPLVVAHAEAEACEGVPFRVIVIYVESGIAAPECVGGEFGAAEITAAPVFLEDDVDDAGSPFRTVFCRGVGDYLDAFDAFPGNLLENLGTVVGCESRFLAVDPYRYRGVASERHLAVLVYLHGGDRFEKLACRLSGRRDVGVDGEYFLVKLEAHLAAYSLYHHLLQHFGVVGELYYTYINIASGHGHGAFLSDAAYVGNTHGVFAVFHLRQPEEALLVGVCAYRHRFPLFVDELDGDKIHRLSRVFVDYAAGYYAVGKHRKGAGQECPGQHYGSDHYSKRSKRSIIVWNIHY